MKSIFIMAHSLEIGGAERSLLGMLENIDTSKYSVDLFLLRHEGEMLPYLPEGVNLLPSEPHYASMGVPIKKIVRAGRVNVAIGRLLGKCAAKVKSRYLHLPKDNNVENEYSHKYTVNIMPKLSHKKYDMAISYMSPHYYVAQKVEATIKIAWIHTDYATFSVDKRSELKMWDAYDYIASISEKVTESFLKSFPELTGKIRLIANAIPLRMMRQQSQANIRDNEMQNDGSFRILSIGRFCTPKNFDNVPFICKKVIDQGINLKWYLIGYGPDENLIREKIEEAGMQNNVIILGKKENPYPYISACDLYVQPSRYEGKCVSVIEAQLLHKPVVITNYSTSQSQLNNGVDGVIVPMENEACAAELCRVIKDNELRSRIAENTRGYNYSNSEEVNKLYSLFAEE